VVTSKLLGRVGDQVRSHCATKGYLGGPNWNPLTPQDVISAHAMARMLTGSGKFDAYVAIAPEGHVYGYFFERLRATVLSVFVDYPPMFVEVGDDLEAIGNGRVLLIEDDIVSGVSLGMVVAALAPYQPRAISLYLGRRGEDQQLQNVHPDIERVYLAEHDLDPAARGRYESEFLNAFGGEA
jgi:hypothetical protein